MGALAGTIALPLAGCSGLSPIGTADASISLEDSTLEVTTPAGVIDEVRIYVEVAFEYTDWEDREITHIGFDTRLDGETIQDRDFHLNHPDWLWADDPGDEDSGAGTYRIFMNRSGWYDRIFLFEDAESYEPEDLSVETPGETVTLDLELDVEMRLVADEDDVVWIGSDSAAIEIRHTYQNGDDDDTGETNGEDGDASMGVGTVRLQAEVDGELVD